MLRAILRSIAVVFLYEFLLLNSAQSFRRHGGKGHDI